MVAMAKRWVHLEGRMDRDEGASCEEEANWRKKPESDFIRTWRRVFLRKRR